jgi:ankyrin repeat protein
MPPKAEAQRRERQDPNIALEELLEQKDLSDEETLDQLRVLIDDGAKVDVPFTEHCPLAVFIRQGKILCINEVIVQKVELDGETWSAVAVCLQSNLSQKTMIKIIQQLMIAGADIDSGVETAREHNIIITPIFSACETGLNLVVKELLRYKPKPDLENGNSRFASCLAVAVSHNDLEIAQMLIKAGADLEARITSDVTCDYFLMTPLLIASQNGYSEMIKLLLEAGANMDATGLNGWNSLHFAARTGSVSACAVIIEHGAESECVIIDSSTTARYLACDLAISYGHVQVVKLLLRNGYTFNNHTEVLFQQCVEMVKTVVETYGYTIDMRDLRAAARFANKDVLNFLTTLSNDIFVVKSDSHEEILSFGKDLETKALLQKIYNKINNIPEIKKEENQEEENATKKKGNRKGKK